jgi:hypothetical protein
MKTKKIIHYQKEPNIMTKDQEGPEETKKDHDADHQEPPKTTNCYGP